MSDGGEVALRTMSAAAKRDGVDIRVNHRVQRVIKNSVGEVVGVEVTMKKAKSSDSLHEKQSYFALADLLTTFNSEKIILPRLSLAGVPQKAMRAISCLLPAPSVRNSAI